MLSIRTLRPLLACLCATGSIALAGCPGDEPQVTAPVDEIVPPALGTRFVYDSYSLDSSGRRVDGSDRVYGDTVVSVGESFEGRDGVALVRSGRQLHWRFRYEPDGSISAHTHPAGGGWWIRMPFAGGAGERVVLEDTTLADGRKVLAVMESIDLGAGTYEYAGRSYTVRTVRLRTTQSTSGAFPHSSTFDDDYTFAPALGWFTRVEQLYEGTSNGIRYKNGTISTLKEVVPG